ncbi:MAG: hypothetical protein ACRD1Z_05290, partial [Vicinamibacteria bacterium]
LIFSEEIDIERFLDVVETLGGWRHPRKTDAGQLQRGDRAIWIFEDVEGLDYGDRPEYFDFEDKLGGPLRDSIIIEISRRPGSDRVAYELIEAAAERFHFIIDTLEGSPSIALTIEELRAHAATNPRNLFEGFERPAQDTDDG